MWWLLFYVVYALGLSAALARAGLEAAPAAGRAPPDTRPDRVLIIGATGGTGKQLVSEALHRGLEVTVLVRDRARLAPDMTARVRVIEGDVLDPVAVESAVDKQQAVVCALGHKRFLGPTRILSQGTANLVQAMQTHGVKRLICETSLGIGASAWRMGLYYTLFVIPVILPFYYWDKTRQERRVARSALDWIVVRPAVLTNAAPRGQYRHGHGIGSFVWPTRIARADVATFMLDQLESNTYLHDAPTVAW